MKHTPGPWKAGRRSVTAPETEDRLGLDVRLYGGNQDDNRANARLIAAAPDLLAAMQLLEPLLESVTLGLGRVWVHTDGSKTDFGAVLDTARAAIAKATGRPA